MTRFLNRAFDGFQAAPAHKRLKGIGDREYARPRASLRLCGCGIRLRYL
jgi:hypothetical protein